MKETDYAITFACYNQISYTKQCIESLIKHQIPLEKLIVVDNGSTDGTVDYLHSLPLGKCILNKKNLGCGVAWNQGILELQAEWTVIMNNDVIVSKNWVSNLINVALQHNLKIISPALIEGELDYDFDLFVEQAATKMKHSLRLGDRHAVCLAVHESVWNKIGYFSPVPLLWGYEDTLFFHAANKACIPMAITGASWLHHYGSITQKAIKQERGLSEKEGLGDRYNYRLLDSNWLQRKLNKFKRIRQQRIWRDNEVAQYQMSLHGERSKQKFRWV